ncbi:hypothetical protein GGR52DRAFT_587285 [Hypoxylon sp. FL1284]|nr:hypothetical protein GGR52DRAFT_587285 [Hypoxylon sp. FL1284]
MTTQLTAAASNDSLQPNLIALCTIMLVLSTTALSLQLWSNYIIASHRWGWDDLFAASALPFLIVENSLVFWWISLGLGKHAATVSTSNLEMGNKILFIDAFLFDWTISLPKFSVLFFYGRIFAGTRRWFSVALWTVGALNTSWVLSNVISRFNHCMPVSAAWKQTPGESCFPQWGWFLGTAIASLVIDILIFLMPMPLLWSLQVPLSRRILVVVIFVFGYAVIVTSIGRLVTLARSGPDLTEDFTWSTVEFLEWCQCEGTLSLISVCLPSIFVLAKRVYQMGIEGALPDSRGKSKLSTRVSDQNRGPFIRMDDYSSQLSSRGGVVGKDVGVTPV